MPNVYQTTTYELTIALFYMVLEKYERKAYISQLIEGSPILEYVRKELYAALINTRV